MTELQMEFAEELRQAELRFWQLKHPQATVTYDKPRNQIVITYPLPEDFSIINGIVAVADERSESSTQ